MAADSGQVVFGERSLTKVAGIYATLEKAEAARAGLLGAGFAAGRVVLLTPEDARHRSRGRLARKLEPETHGIWKTIVRAHAVAGGIGLLLGVGLWAALLVADNVLVASSRVLSLTALAFLGVAFGGMAGGLVALRPDHAALITSLRAALRDGRHAVVAHLSSEDGAKTAEAALQPGAERVEKTL